MSFKKLSYLCIALGLGCAMTFASCGDDEDKDNNAENGNTENGNDSYDEQKVKIIMEGDDCNSETFKDVCDTEGSLLQCKDNKVVRYDCNRTSENNAYSCAILDDGIAKCYQHCQYEDKGTTQDACTEDKSYTTQTCTQIDRPFYHGNCGILDMDRTCAQITTFYSYPLKIYIDGDKKACDENGPECCFAEQKNLKAGDPCTKDDFYPYCNDDDKLVLCEEKEQNGDPVVQVYDCSMMNNENESYTCATFDEGASCHAICSGEGTLYDYCDPEYDEKEGPEYTRSKCEISKDFSFVWHVIGRDKCEGSDALCCAELMGLE